MDRAALDGIIVAAFVSALAVFGWLIKQWIGGLSDDILKIGAALHDLADTLVKHDRRLTRLEAKFDMHEVIEHSADPHLLRRRDRGDDTT